MLEILEIGIISNFIILFSISGFIAFNGKQLFNSEEDLFTLTIVILLGSAMAIIIPYLYIVALVIGLTLYFLYWLGKKC